MNQLYRRAKSQPKIRKLVYLVFTVIFIYEISDKLSSKSRFVVKEERLRADDSSEIITDKPPISSSSRSLNETGDKTKSTSLKDLIEKLNGEGKINNEKFILDFIKSAKGDQSNFLVILVQVHNRLLYLRELINSLRNVKHIEEALLIFSHDVYDEKLNQLVESIDFSSTVQIFYPFSLQIYPNEFPGEDPNDCPRDMSKIDALIRKCNNAASPDRHGHYRESKIVQIKHHWFWKISFVFDELKLTKNIQDLSVLLLEEDYYLLPDAIVSLRNLKSKVKKVNQIVSLSSTKFDQQDITGNSMNKYRISTWHSPNHNTGMLVNREVWNLLKDCSNTFCTYDDYNWDWTFEYVGQTCLKEEFESIHLTSSRVIHIGECGTHHTNKNCQPNEAVKKLEKFVQENKDHIFPEELEQVSKLEKAATKLVNSNGGWGDPRDHNLCKSFILKYSDVL